MVAARAKDVSNCFFSRSIVALLPLVLLPFKEAGNAFLVCVIVLLSCSLGIEDAKVHSFRYRSSDLNLAAGAKRIVFGLLQDRVEPSTSDANVASGKEGERERILHQTSQRESVIIAVYPHDAHEIRQHLHGRLRAIDFCLDR